MNGLKKKGERERKGKHKTKFEYTKERCYRGLRKRNPEKTFSAWSGLEKMRVDSKTEMSFCINMKPVQT